VKALLRVDDKKELSNPPRIQEKEFKEPEKISLWTKLGWSERFVSVMEQLHEHDKSNIGA
jgi:uncharacterized membrane protein YagU involved in acid resistance